MTLCHYYVAIKNYGTVDRLYTGKQILLSAKESYKSHLKQIMKEIII
jgi:hypothetical protein